MRNKGWVIWALIFAFMCSCSDGVKENAPDVKESVYQALASSDYSAVKEQEPELDGEFTECEKHYLYMLVNIQELLDTLENLMNMGAEAATQNALSDIQTLGVDLMSYVHTYLDPYENLITELRDNALYAYQNNCTFYTPYGVNFSITGPESWMSFSVTLGYQWDQTVARVVYAVGEFILSMFDFLYSHSLEVEVFQMPDLNEENTVEMIRSLGALMDWNPDLLAFPVMRKTGFDLTTLTTAGLTFCVH